ncbi:MAG: TonB-dependent receptor domain-containing protein, partial [Bryobacteraceae bacterium]
GRNRTFFMADYEGLRLVRQSTSLDTVLTPLMRQGNFSEIRTQLSPAAAYPGNIVPTSSLSPQALRLLQYMPLPSRPGINNNFEATYPNNDRFNQTIDRLDQNIGDKSRFYFRYALNNEEYLTGATGAFNGTYLPVTTRNWVFGYTQTITPNMVNDFRVGRQHLETNALNYWYVNNLKTAGSDLGIPGFTGDVTYSNPGIPTITNTGFMSLGNAATNWFQFDTTWQGTDSLTYTHGAHTLVAGAELRKLITSRSAVNSANGVFNFTGFYTGSAQADFMLGLVQSVTTPGPEIRNQVAEWRDGFFVVDNWRATKRLTANLGLRYELPTVPYTVNGYAVILNREQTALIPPNPPQPGFHFINPNHKNFAPRLGLAYRVTDKTVVRAGYGIYYNPNQTNTFTFLSNNPPFSAVITCTGSAAAPITFNNPTPASACGVASRFNIISPNPDLPTPYMNQWSFGLQQGLWSSAALDIQYIGSQATHLDRSYYPNTPLPGPGTVNARRPNPRFADIRIIQNDEISSYNGLSITLRQRVSHGATALVSYTWSHTLDVTTDSNGGGPPQDPYNWRGDYGNSNWDVRHRFVGSFTYALPIFANTTNGFVKAALGGWQTNGIVTLQSGFPFNVTVPGDPANTGRGGTERPNLIGAATSNCGRGHLNNCISGASAFAIPVFAYGNFGRNVLYGPGLYNVDFSLFKNFRFTERLNLQFRSEFFNLFNTPALSNPNATFNATNFGTITSTKRDNRQIQFALKLQF